MLFFTAWESQVLVPLVRFSNESLEFVFMKKVVYRTRSYLYKSILRSYVVGKSVIFREFLIRRSVIIFETHCIQSYSWVPREVYGTCWKYMVVELKVIGLLAKTVIVWKVYGLLNYTVLDFANYTVLKLKQYGLLKLFGSTNES